MKSSQTVRKPFKMSNAPFVRPVMASLLTVSLAVTSCSSTTKNTDIQNTDFSSDGQTDTEKATDILSDNLPERDYNDADIHLLVRTERLYYLDAESENGDTLNDAVYRRNQAVEERFHIRLHYHDVASNQNLFTAAVSSSVMADDDGYDIICPDYWWGLDTEGYFLDLNSLKYLNFDRPWWCQGWNKNAEINGVCYTAVGYYCLDLLRNTEVVYFNKDLIASFGLDNPYQLVDSGDWTIGTVLEMAKTVGGDVDGNSIIDENDRYGIYINTQARNSLYNSLGTQMVKKTSNGSYVLGGITEKYLKINDILVNMMNDSAVCFASDITVDYTTTAAYKPFCENNLLFSFFALTAVEAMRASDVNFGIVPVPKLDNDSDYISSNYGCTLSAIPVNTPDAERSAILLEALNAESYYTVAPEYFETVLKGKLARDDESQAMLDMVFSNLQFDFGFIHNTHLGIQNSMYAVSADVASAYATQESSYQAKLQNLLDAYASIQEK